MTIAYSFDSEEPAKSTRVAAVSKLAPDATERVWRGEWASEYPLNTFQVRRDGGGAGGSAGYLVLPVRDAPQFYAESTPQWWDRPTTFDLRAMRASFYLREIEPITVNDGYTPPPDCSSPTTSRVRAIAGGIC